MARVSDSLSPNFHNAALFKQQEGKKKGDDRTGESLVSPLLTMCVRRTYVRINTYIPMAPLTTTQHALTFIQGNVGEVSCPRTLTGSSGAEFELPVI